MSEFFERGSGKVIDAVIIVASFGLSCAYKIRFQLSLNRIGNADKFIQYRTGFTTV